IQDNDQRFQVIIRMTKTNLGVHICKKVLVNQGLMISYKLLVVLLFKDLIKICLMTTRDYKRMLGFMIVLIIKIGENQAKKNYQIHLTATIDCIRFLLRQGLSFRGNDETDDSVNQEIFLELLNFLAQHNEEIDRAFKNTSGNLKLRAPSIKKKIVRAVTNEMTKVIVNDLGDE
ncbi:hypothetical protein S245_037057, partial [Arachis hypogaea]